MKKILLIILIAFCSLSVSFAQKGKSRSTETGRYVSKDYAKQNPKTTVTEYGGSKTSSTKSRSAETGRYTTKSYSNKNPKTTVVEHPKRGKKK